MSRLSLFTLIVTAGLLFLSCGDDGEPPYPSMVSDIVCVATNDNGAMVRLLTDDGHEYAIMNPQYGYSKYALYRGMAGYVFENEKAVRLHNLVGVNVLRDSSLVLRHDPTPAVSVWRSGRFINMQLAPKTQGGRHFWGFAIDSVVGRSYHLSLHHCQNGDPESYSATVYASLPVDSVKGSVEGDTLLFTIRDYKGYKTWNFIR